MRRTSSPHRVCGIEFDRFRLSVSASSFGNRLASVGREPNSVALRTKSRSTNRLTVLARNLCEPSYHR